MAQSQLYRQLRDIDNTLTLMWLDERFSMHDLERADLFDRLGDQQWAAADHLGMEVTGAIEDIRRELSRQYKDIVKALKDSQIPPLQAEVQELLARAKDNEQHGLYEEALEDIKRAEAKDPYDFGIHLWLGSLYLRQFGDPNTALAHYDKAVRYATPRSEAMAARAWLGVAMSREALADIAGAHQASEAAVRLDFKSAAILYEHSAHSAQMARAEQAQMYLEQAVHLSPVYWGAARGDERFQPLGDVIPQLLDRLATKVRADLQHLADRHSELISVTSSWEITPRALSPKGYVPLESELREVLGTLEHGDYPDQIAAVSKGRELLSNTVSALESQLEKQIDDTEKALDRARGSIEYRRQAATEAQNKSFTPMVKTAGWALGAVFLLLSTIWCGATQITTADTTFGQIVGWIGLFALLGGLVYVAIHAYESYKDTADYKEQSAAQLQSIDTVKAEGRLAKERLEVLQAQRASLQDLIAQW